MSVSFSQLKKKEINLEDNEIDVIYRIKTNHLFRNSLEDNKKLLEELDFFVNTKVSKLEILMLDIDEENSKETPNNEKIEQLEKIYKKEEETVKQINEEKYKKEFSLPFVNPSKYIKDINNILKVVKEIVEEQEKDENDLKIDKDMIKEKYKNKLTEKRMNHIIDKIISKGLTGKEAEDEIEKQLKAISKRKTNSMSI